MRAVIHSGQAKLAAATSLALTLLALLAAVAAAEGWHSDQPPPPPPPEGEIGAGVPVPLGHIGEISFWAPNRGLLITAGTETIPAGLYYYNGVTWRELSKVCGGAEGRIAWAGPEDFWTISNQEVGQQFANGVNVELEQEDRSLCHFEPGPSGKLEVVASYGEPIGVPGSYQHMDAAACSEANDCWFAGGPVPVGPNGGTFHLHWNGHTLTPVPSLETPESQLQDPPGDVTGIVFYKGHFYESAQSSSFPLHKIVEGSSNPFVPLLPEGPLAPAPKQPGEREPFFYTGPGAFRFSVDSNTLWAISGQGLPALLLGSGSQFQQVTLSDPDELDEVAGIAAEPGTSDAWVSIDPPSESSKTVARVARIQTNGSVEGEVQLPEVGEGLGDKGAAGTIACPAQGDCWVATSQGWLFHLGGSYPEDGDPAFQTLIDYRPPDASIPFAAPEEEFPEDDSGANVAPELPTLIKQPAAPPAPRARKPLFSNVSSRVLRGTTLALTFTLATKSHVRLLALRRERTVAKTASRVLAGGRHTLRLRLSRRAWPTKLDLRVTAIGTVPLQPSGGGPTGGPTVVTTSLRDPAAGLSQAPSAPALSLPLA
jgi:hypothetical protein